MSEHREMGVVYHIDMALIQRARERDLKTKIELIDSQIDGAQRDLLYLKAAERALWCVQMTLQKMRDIAIEATINPHADVKAMNKELESYKDEIQKIIQDSTYDGINLLDGSMGSIETVIEAVSKALEKTV